jgi:sarcosine oxidase
MGSAALAHCALRGARVCGFEQFGREHELGASSGKTRIIRQAYFEDPAYVPLLLRAYELWRDLEECSGEELLRRTGLLMAGSERSEVITGSARAAQLHRLPVEYLSTADLRARFPMLRVRDGEVGIFEREGGAVFPERAIHAHLELAQSLGAQTSFGTALHSWESARDGVRIELADGTSVTARKLVLTLGPWFAQVMRDAGVTLQVQRNVQAWFEPQSDAYAAGRFPAFLIERQDLPAPLYGFPDFGDGVKAAFHGLGEITTADALQREIDKNRDVDPLAHAVQEWMPDAALRFLGGKACMYALTPDRHFVVGVHPKDERVILCGGFSGHGFKFASVIGEIAAQLALDGGTPHNIAFLSMQRFSK